MPKIDYIIANPPYGEKNLFKGSQMVGFNQEESKEFAEYCKNYIDKIDK